MPGAGDGAEGERRRSSAQGDSSGNRLPGGCYEGSVRPARRSQEDAGEEDAARPGCIAFRLGDSCETGSGQPACYGRPAHGEAAVLQHPLQASACRRCGLAVSQPCRGHEEPVEVTDLSATGRRTPTDQVGAWRRARSVPGVQRQERSTPTARLMSSGMKRSTPTRRTGAQRVKDQRQLQPPDLDRGRRATSNPPVRSALPAKDQRQLRFSSSTLVGDRGRANHPPVVPVQQGSRTQVSMVGNLGKSQTVKSLSPARDPQKRACEAPFRDFAKIVHKS